MAQKQKIVKKPQNIAVSSISALPSNLIFFLEKPNGGDIPWV